MRLIDADVLMRQIKRVVAEFLYVGNHSGLFLKHDSCNPAEFTRGYERGAMEIASVYQVVSQLMPWKLCGVRIASITTCFVLNATMHT